MNYITLLYLRYKVWHLKRKISKLRSKKASLQPRDEKGRFIAS